MAIIISAFVFIKSKEDYKPSFVNIKYGDHPRQCMDIWLPKTNSPSSVIVFFHGGGFSVGEKYLSDMQKDVMKKNKNVASISINYRLYPESIFPSQFEDAQKAIQFIKYNAKKFNIDKNKIIIAGESAGGILALWIGLHNDLTNKQSSNPIEKESTKVRAIWTWGAMTTFDHNIVKEKIGGPVESVKIWPKLFGVETFDELNSTAMKEVVYELSPISHVSEISPPMFMIGYTPTIKPLPQGISNDFFVHNAKFALLLKNKMNGYKVPCYVVWEDKKHLSKKEIEELQDKFFDSVL